PIATAQLTFRKPRLRAADEQPLLRRYVGGIREPLEPFATMMEGDISAPHCLQGTNEVDEYEARLGVLWSQPCESFFQARHGIRIPSHLGIGDPEVKQRD